MASTTSPMVIEQWVEALNSNIPQIERNLFDKSPSEYGVIAKEIPYERWVHQFQAVQGIPKPVLNRDLETPPQVSPVKGYPTVLRQNSYRSQIILEETAFRTAEHKNVYDNLEDMVESQKTLKDGIGVNFFNNGFTDGLSQNIVEYDGTARAAFSTGHYYEDGNGTFSNYLNSQVPPSIDIVYQLIMQYLMRLKDFSGNFITWDKTFTIVTPTLTPAYGVAAEEIIRSDTRNDSANRATNILKGIRLNHVPLNNLTSTTKWFIITPTMHRAYPLRLAQAIDREITPMEKGGALNPHAYYITSRSQFGFAWVNSYRGVLGIGN